ncbi:seven-hairpin glycosidase [Westerdykella ornata]|uniref:alpha-1,2-Mannosidase n=1 Tax=Westerdykella ornata TaxID=318751 RepID=A0A6A6JP62_WESOR|nr:seven-hairpin glycosidase [Westerdykella ornata]KAF2278411.1 seven-hairpin glycosidase [Westerdykella ornata]
MLRYRRYRVFVAFAVIALFALYRFGAPSASWQDTASSQPQPISNWWPRPQLPHETKKLDLEIPIAKVSQTLRRPPPVVPASSPIDRLPIEQASPDEAAERPTITSAPTSSEPIRWKKQTEHFPVPSTALIQLPTGKPIAIPRIQHAFKPESAAEKADREEKLEVIRNVFKRSWDGYREYAWLQDELSPTSGRFRNPFAGWGATLVDALDTLWIMGLREEFDEAAKAVDKIDFTTTPRNDIPLFETTIRYLGGLLAAYDISGGQYKNLLHKAVELAEVLMSAFDTPNRMPETYYHWKPNYPSAPRRAGTSAVLAEIGSLSLEFTRLSQLTGDQKYYDAVARITDNLEEFQNKTRLPGMWPVLVDISGCKLVDHSAPQPVVETSSVIQEPESSTAAEAQSTATLEVLLSPNGKEYKPLDLPDPVVLVAGTSPSEPAQPPKALRRRQLGNVQAIYEEDGPAPTPIGPHCEDQPFLSAAGSGDEEYTLGGMSDSTYEYLPKEWLLLGGLVDKYRAMYESSADVIRKNLIFRPMVPDEADVLFSGKLHVPPPGENKPRLEAEYAHLTCFAGGMFGMGAKVYDRPEDLEIAKKLTEGCVWSYDMTATGIMPEAFISTPCQDIHDCKWNETRYWNEIDPNAQERIDSYKLAMERYEKEMISASAWYASQLAAMTATPTPSASNAVVEVAATATSGVTGADASQNPAARKRQLDVEPHSNSRPNTVPSFQGSLDRKVIIEDGDPILLGQQDEALQPATPVQSSSDEPQPEFDAETSTPTMPEFPYVYSPLPPTSHEDLVKNRIEQDRLPKGVVAFPARNYILRPEAIESVWYMYRITGSPHWREAGWRMFLAIESATATTFGNSAIDDVTKKDPVLRDEMESFWLAETLKYFYLLFSEESVVSLDEWVLNTEAHPFKRPK